MAALFMGTSVQLNCNTNEFSLTYGETYIDMSTHPVLYISSECALFDLSFLLPGIFWILEKIFKWFLETARFDTSNLNSDKYEVLWDQV